MYWSSHEGFQKRILKSGGVGAAFQCRAVYLWLACVRAYRTTVRQSSYSRNSEVKLEVWEPPCFMQSHVLIYEMLKGPLRQSSVVLAKGT